MDFIKRLQKQLKDSPGPLPWPYGFDPEDRSPSQQGIVRLFSKEELLAMSKHNPFLKERNKEIRALPALGLTFPQIARLTGLSISHLKRITSEQQYIRNRNRTGVDLRLL